LRVTDTSTGSPSVGVAADRGSLRVERARLKARAPVQIYRSLRSDLLDIHAEVYPSNLENTLGLCVTEGASTFERVFLEDSIVGGLVAANANVMARDLSIPEGSRGVIGAGDTAENGGVVLGTDILVERSVPSDDQCDEKSSKTTVSESNS
jgi:hypothetical protein